MIWNDTGGKVLLRLQLLTAVVGVCDVINLSPSSSVSQVLLISTLYSSKNNLLVHIWILKLTLEHFSCFAKPAQHSSRNLSLSTDSSNPHDCVKQSKRAKQIDVWLLHEQYQCPMFILTIKIFSRHILPSQKEIKDARDLMSFLCSDSSKNTRLKTIIFKKCYFAKQLDTMVLKDIVWET